MPNDLMSEVIVLQIGNKEFELAIHEAVELWRFLGSVLSDAEKTLH